MNRLSDYQAAALGTAIYPGKGEPLGLSYVALKGAGEAGEFANHVYYGEPSVDLLRKEVGDELWYLAAKTFEIGTNLTELVGSDWFEDIRIEEDTCLNALALRGADLAGRFAEQVGKAIRDDASELTVDRRETLRNNVYIHLGHLAAKAAALETTLGEIAAGNIAKLADRKARGVLGGSGDNR